MTFIDVAIFTSVMIYISVDGWWPQARCTSACAQFLGKVSNPAQLPTSLTIIFKSTAIYSRLYRHHSLSDPAHSLLFLYPLHFSSRHCFCQKFFSARSILPDNLYPHLRPNIRKEEDASQEGRQGGEAPPGKTRQQPQERDRMYGHVRAWTSASTHKANTLFRSV